MSTNTPRNPDDPLVRLAVLASTQAGLLTRRQVLEHGLKDHHIRSRLDAGVFTPVRPGIFRFTSAPPDRRQHLTGAVLLAGDGAALSHRTAAIEHGTHQFSGEVVEVSAPASTNRRLAGVVLHRSRHLPSAHVTKLDGVPVTTPARTLVDLACVLPEGRVARQQEEWLADRKVTVAKVTAMLDELGGRGRPEVMMLRRLLEGRVLGDRPGDSTDDALRGQLFTDRRLPVPLHNHLLEVDGEVLEIDWAFPAELVAVEINGFSVHTRSERIYERELLKRRLLARTPWLLLEFTAGRLRRQPDRVVAEVERHRLARRGVGLAS